MEPHEIVELLAVHEEMIGQLYLACGRRFIKHADFWNEMAEEEKQHAYWIRRFLIRIRNGEGKIKSDLFSSPIITNSLTAIEELAGNVNNPEFTMVDALAFAAQCEQNLMEGHFYEIFEGNCAEVKQMQYALDLVVREHFKKIKDLAEKIGSQD